MAVCHSLKIAMVRSSLRQAAMLAMRRAAAILKRLLSS